MVTEEEAYAAFLASEAEAASRFVTAPSATYPQAAGAYLGAQGLNDLLIASAGAQEQAHIGQPGGFVAPPVADVTLEQAFVPPPITPPPGLPLPAISRSLQEIEQTGYENDEERYVFLWNVLQRGGVLTPDAQAFFDSFSQRLRAPPPPPPPAPSFVSPEEFSAFLGSEAAGREQVLEQQAQDLARIFAEEAAVGARDFGPEVSFVGPLGERPPQNLREQARALEDAGIYPRAGLGELGRFAAGLAAVPVLSAAEVLAPAVEGLASVPLIQAPPSSLGGAAPPARLTLGEVAERAVTPIPEAEAAQEFVQSQLEQVPLVGPALGLASELVLPTTPIEFVAAPTALGLAGDISDAARLARMAGEATQPLLRRGALEFATRTLDTPLRRVAAATVDITGAPRPIMGGAPSLPPLPEGVGPSPVASAGTISAPRLPGRTPRPSRATQPFFSLDDFDAVADRVVKTQPDIFSKMQETLQAIPGVRSIGQFLGPESAALARAQQGDPIALAMVKRDIYEWTQSSKARVGFFDWLNRHQDALGLDAQGIAHKVTPRLGAQIPDQARGRLDDILEHTNDYQLTPAQRRAVRELRITFAETFNQALPELQAAGVRVPEARFNYFPHKVLKGPEGEKQVSSGITPPGGLRPRRGFVKERTFDDIRQALEAGYKVASPLEALQDHFQQVSAAVADARALREVRALGVKPSERVPQQLRDAVNEARTRLRDLKASRRRVPNPRTAQERALNRMHQGLANNQELLARQQEVLARTRPGTKAESKVQLKIAEIQGRIANLQENIAALSARLNRPVASDADIAVAEEELLRARRALQYAARRAATPQLGEAFAYGRILPGDVIEQLSAYSQLPNDIITETFNLQRATQVTGDLSQLLVQGSTIVWRDPIAWAKSAVLSTASLVDQPLNYFTKNLDAIKEAIDYGAALPPTDFLLRQMGGPGAVIGRLPVVKELQRSFEWFTFVGQVERFKALRQALTAQAQREGRSGLSQEELREIASAVRKELGIVLRPGLTKRQRALDIWTLYAPRFFQAYAGLLSDALRPGIAGDEARKAIGSVIGGAMASTMGANLALTGEIGNFLDPDDKSWFGIPVGNSYFYPLGAWHPWIRTIVAAGKHAQEGDTDALLRDAAYFLRGKQGLASGMLLDLMLGESITGDPASLEPATLARYLAERFGPIGLRQVAQGIASGEPAQLAEFAGARTSQLTTAERVNRARSQIDYASVLPSEVAAHYAGKDYYDLGPRARAAVDNALRESNPKLLEQLTKERRQRGQVFQVVRDEVEQFRRAQDPRLTEIQNALASRKGDIRQLLEEADDIRNRIRGVTEEKYSSKAYQDAVAKLPENDMYKLLDAWRQIPDRARIGGTANVDWDRVDDMQAVFLKRVAEEYGRDVANAFAYEVQDQPRAEDHKLFQFIDAANKRLGQYFDWAEANEATTKEREAFLRANPTIDALLWVMGYSQKVKSEQAAEAAKRILAGLRTE